MTFKRRRLNFESLEARRMLAAVDIPDDLTGQPLDQVLAPLNIDDSSGIRGAEIRISYDTNVLDITQSDVTAGSVWTGTDVDVVANVDGAAGTVIVFLFASSDLSSASGSLVNFRFTIRGNAVANSSTVIDLANVRLNEGAINVDPAPQVGPDTTDGLITITATGGNASVSGFVFADTNVNNQPDALEGLPNVLITLENTTTGSQVQARTGNNGQYVFENLAAGSYRLLQVQPAAYINGGPNEIAVQLSSGQALAGQNFRELGLRPEFIYSRLVTTTVMPVGSTRWIAAMTRIHNDAEAAAGNTASMAASNALTLAQASNSDPSPEGEAPAPTAPRIPLAGSTVVQPDQAVVLQAEGEAPHPYVTTPVTARSSATLAPAASNKDVPMLEAVWGSDIGTEFHHAATIEPDEDLRRATDWLPTADASVELEAIDHVFATLL